MHWGKENFYHPRPAHVRLGRKLIDAGFSLVIGHHPHTVQGFERYNGGWIFYSLGNFFFPDHQVDINERRYNANWIPRRSWGIVPLFAISQTNFELREVKIVRYSRNGILRLGEFPRFQARLLKLSSDLAHTTYCRQYRKWREREELASRVEECLNREDKLRAVTRKVLRFLKKTRGTAKHLK
jgi:hypothetical protein